jgi:hypothetical protein
MAHTQTVRLDALRTAMKDAGIDPQQVRAAPYFPFLKVLEFVGTDDDLAAFRRAMSAHMAELDIHDHAEWNFLPGEIRSAPKYAFFWPRVKVLP